MRGEAWTPEHVDLLKKLWAAGATAGAIASRLGGMSRSAVLGKIFRLRLGAGDAAPPAGGKMPAREKSGRGKASVAAGALPALFASATSPPLARRRRGTRDKLPETQPAVRPPDKTLLELTNTSCRWPHGRPGTRRFFFCGAAEADLAHGIPYCAQHMRRAYGGSASVGTASRIGS